MYFRFASSRDIFRCNQLFLLVLFGNSESFLGSSESRITHALVRGARIFIGNLVHSACFIKNLNDK